MLKELKPHEFTERLKPIFDGIADEFGAPDRWNPAHFFPNWQRLMEQGIARTWEIPGAVLGALFYPDIYSGKQRAAVMFWFSEKRVRGTGAPVKLFDAFERAAEGCEVKSSAAHMNLVPQLRKFYLKKGYRLSEEVFSKYE
jgi:hypothetical protein